MFVLDTNVISETFKPQPDAGVAAWMESSFGRRSYVTAMTKAELLVVLANMPDGKRKAALGSVIGAFFTMKLKTPVLAFGDREAEAYAEIVSKRRVLGHPIREFDAQIASVALCRSFAVVTRNVADFVDCGINIVNPWEGA
ncbi:type II toxin-antitoxin system VapC family toxin [Mesorhizobium sp. B3-1-9]|uniref:type II toxin-antitoxin system VapC family toxin n=1 Tax=unclassified Mesorhizobium TaxID=325217 RepID=UPI00112CA0EB|nr:MULTISPECIES: type II toxin-antitoxin system VapC family toxin [unclassified Mesorhizobium]TPI34302.1 type II toxin-antitoxin system VapC family toxin [Mesorhizobium sp. B3-1-9]TPI43170.1 type II toxin-antitoxin system VapC family toxin [Mesorhizobium sp. B3-1-6]UCI27813.1 type II toxin-antitoxin system VapC family toxin [Mesorhizobium sp. B2-8-5]